MKRTFYLIPMMLAALSAARAQQVVDRYKKADRLRDQVQDKALYIPASPSAIPGRQAFLYSVQTSKGTEWLVGDAQGRQPAFDPARLAAVWQKTTGEKTDPYRLPFRVLTPVREGFEFTASGAVWQYAPEKDQLRKLRNIPEARYWGDRDEETGRRTVYSPDSSYSAFIREYNVVIRSEKTKTETPLSFDGSAGEYYSGDIRWSPDSRKLVSVKIRKNTPHQIYLIRSSPADQLQPKLETRNYLKPGDALPVHQPVLFLVDDKRAIPLDMSLFREQFSLSRPEWRKDGRAFAFEFNERGHQIYRVLEADGTTGRVRAIIEEKSPTFIDYSGKKYREDLGDGAEIVWASERDGWNHLYLFDGKTGKIKKQVTRGEWVVRRVVNVDEKSRTVLFAASGRNPGEDPYLLHYYRIKLDGTGLTDLTPEPANHSITLADSTFLDTYSRADMAPVTVLRRLSDGSVIRELERADISAYEKAGWKMPEVFSAKGRDGQTDIWGIIIRPTDFDPSKKYPVIENIYAGPHSAFVPKSFLTFTAMHELAELGFIVVQIDGMGTSNRSKAFHDICWKNLKDAGFPDRIKWMEAAAQKYPSMDLSRVGLYGTSAGGQSAAGGLLFHPDFYKVAVASCGCHDNRMDKIWWNEQWMGYPIGPQYAECSNVVNAGKLKGELLLLVGEMDDNVDPSSTYQFADALIKANKNFDLVVLPGVGHSSGGAFGERKRRDFFVRHLLGFQPPAWNALIPNP